MLHQGLGGFAPRGAIAQAHPGGGLGLEAVGRQRRGSAVNREILAQARVDHDRDAAAIRAIDQRAQQAGREQSLVDIGDQYAVRALQFIRDARLHRSFAHRRERSRVFFIDAQQLLSRAMRRLHRTEHPIFDGGRTIGIGEHRTRCDSEIGENFAQQAAIAIGADDAER